MSNITDSRVFKRIGAGPYLKMLAEREENDKEARISNRSGDANFASIFDNSDNCHDINQIVNTYSLNNYYEYTARVSDICNNKILFPREFYLTGIDLIPETQTTTDISGINNINTYFNTASITFSNDKAIINNGTKRYPVKKIKKSDRIELSESSSPDFKISFKGFI